MALTAMPTGDLYSSAVIGYVNSANLPQESTIQSIQIEEHLSKVSETEGAGAVPAEVVSYTHSSYHHHTPHQRKNLLSVSPKKLHYRRGISRGGDNYHRPGLHIADSDFIPQEFTDSVNHAISQYGTESGRSSPTTDQFQFETSNHHWTANLTGNTTDRSSTNSTVTYDDFDKEASLNVQKLFDGIDSMLFEAVSHSSTSQLYDECRDWSAAFPHLRILGDQLLQSSEQGYHMVESRLSHTQSLSSDTQDSEHRPVYLDTPSNFSSDSSGLAIAGTRAKTHPYSATPTPTSDIYQPTPDMVDISEEIFVLDGYYEDIIAIDSDLHEDPLDSKTIASTQRQRRSRYPPVTPNACAKDGIVHSVFDVVWTLLTDAMRILLQRYSEYFVITHPMAIEAPEESDHDDGHVKLPQISKHGSRLDGMHMTHAGHRLISGSVLSRPSNPFALSSHNSNDQLMKILQISKMGMTERKEKTFLEEGTETPVGMLMGPTSAMKKSNGGRNTSASRRPLGPMRSKLVPLNDSRVRTPNVDDEVVRGQGITAVGKRLNSPPPMGSRMLPPINSDSTGLPQGHLDTTPPQTRGIQKRGNRASSAIAEKETRTNLREKISMIAETRPSTTHTIYPTEQSGILNMGLLAQPRSSTPMERTSTKLRNDLLLGITGSSLIGQHPALDEEVEGRYESVQHHSQWAPPHTATVGYRRGNKPLNSFVR